MAVAASQALAQQDEGPILRPKTPPAKPNWRMSELRTFRRIVYDVKTNWKLIVLNYNECLHCPLCTPS